MIEPMEPDRNGSEPYEKMFEMFMAWVQGKRSGLMIVILKQLKCFQECLKRKRNDNVVKMAKIP